MGRKLKKPRGRWDISFQGKNNMQKSNEGLHPFFQTQQEPIETIHEDVQPQKKQDGLHPFFSDKPEQTSTGIQGSYQKTSSIPKQIAKEFSAGALGTYGDIAETIGLQKENAPKLLPSQKEKFTKEALASDKELINLASEDLDILPSYSKLPTSKDIREGAAQFFGIGEPKTHKERLIGKAAGTVGGIGSLGGGAGVIGRGIAGSIAGQEVKEAGFSDALATTVDIGTNLGLGLVKTLVNKGTATQLASKLYKNAEEALPAEAVGDAKNLEKSLESLSKKMQLGLEASSEKTVIDTTDKILEKIKDGKMSYKEAVASKRSLNEIMGEIVFKTPTKAAKARASKLLGEVKSSLDDFIKTSKDKYPIFYKNQVAADQAFATIAQSKRVTNFVSKTIAAHPKEVASGTIALAWHYGLMPSLFGIAKGAAGVSAVKAGEFGYRFMKSPVLRKHYNEIINSALKENKAGVLNNLRKINKEIEGDPEIMWILESK